MGLRLVTGPATEPVTLAEAKAHLRVTHASEDDLITSLISASRSYVEDYTERALMEQTLELSLDAFPARGAPIVLHRPPLLADPSLTVKYDDSDGTEQTLDSEAYVIAAGSEPPRVALVPDSIWPTSRPVPDAVRVRYVAGYADAAAVPAPIRAAILLMVGHLYVNREAVTTGTIVAETPFAVKALLAPYRVLEFA